MKAHLVGTLLLEDSIRLYIYQVSVCITQTHNRLTVVEGSEEHDCGGEGYVGGVGRKGSGNLRSLVPR